MFTEYEEVLPVQMGDRLVDCTVKYVYYPPYTGTRDSFGVPLEPDDEEEIEITSIVPLDSKLNVYSQVSKEMLECLEDAIWGIINSTEGLDLWTYDED